MGVVWVGVGGWVCRLGLGYRWRSTGGAGSGYCCVSTKCNFYTVSTNRYVTNL